MSEIATTTLYRIENPQIPAEHDPGVPHGALTSHPDIVGQWFSPNLGTAMGYLRKSTQTFGKEAHPVDGARLVLAKVPRSQLESLHVSEHPIAATMDVEGDNYILPRDGSTPTEEIALDETIEDLKGHLGNFANLMEAQRRINDLLENLGRAAVH